MSERTIKFLRFLWYLVSRVLIWGAIVPLVLLSFYAAMDYMNVRILTSDGLEARAGVIIAGDDPTPLSKVFSKGFLDSDTMLYSNLYRQYIVSDFDYTIEIPIVVIMPWRDTVVLRITEQIDDIEAEVYASVENSASVSETPPEWNNATYELTLVRFENNWRIVSMEEMQEEPTGSVAPSEGSISE